MSSAEKLVEVYRTTGALQAQVVKTKLEAYGIPVLLRSQAATSVHVFTVDGMGEVRVLVPAGRAAEAREVLKEE